MRLELHLNTEFPFLDLNLLIFNDIISTKLYDIEDDFGIVSFPFFLEGDVPRATCYGVYSTYLFHYNVQSNQ